MRPAPPLASLEQLLLGGALAPLTTHLVFLECPAHVAAEGFRAWRGETGQECGSARLAAPLQDVLGHLHPLRFDARRHLFVPTVGRWTAYFNNYPLGTNVDSVVPPLAGILGVRAVQVTAGPLPDEGEELLEFTVFNPEGTGPVTGRSVGLRNTRGWWRFWRLGTPLPFEDLAAYRDRRRKRRFTYDHLVAYSAALGLSPFDSTFYTPGQGAWLVSCGPRLLRL
ncbi:hypothetical protein [Deinococcus sp. QL22]|uniref:hypothetical protein n=1 Tax=Deinococcus sp. QL22 TaxID=2939437 RepID=UPI0020174514|nr:hypothetical protein [Deinococcus sp. QL22]UQN06548.1 hypothetical protein M1R55_01100 [Deinococcus sp. QL22]